jgi:hypothetical protein
MAATLQQRKWTRLALYCYIVVAASPIRYWPLGDGKDAAPSWVFALNYAPAHGLKVGRDVLFTYGFLSYLTFPQAFGNNLGQALMFQTCLWLALAWVMACLFFGANLPLRNLAAFSFFFALSIPLYWFDFGGVENLVLVIMLVEFHLSRLRGSLRHYLFALVSVGIVPMIKLSAGLIAAAALAGFLADQVLQKGSKAKREIALALLIPAAITGAWIAAVLSGWRDILLYLHSAADLVEGYTAAMSQEGELLVVLLAWVVLAVLVYLLCVQAKVNAGWARFSICVFAGPVLLAFKHGFVRQDIHVVSYFSFSALVIALISLKLPLEGRRALPLGCGLVVFTLCWTLVRIKSLEDETVFMDLGARNAKMAWNALRPEVLRRRLVPSSGGFHSKSFIEPEIRAIVGAAPVASLSNNYSILGIDGWNLRFYPVIQMYAAYTPYLDGLNAAWIRDHGPTFLIYDGLAIDHRDAWAATPATWLEVYRGYETRWLGSRNLLLQRRATPRFTTLNPVGRFTVMTPLSISLPHSETPVFWSLRCGNTLTGEIRKLLFRMPESEILIENQAGIVRRARVNPEMLGAPVMGTYLPATLTEFAAVFQAKSAIPAVRKVAFGGPGIGSYTSVCEAELASPP